MGRYPDNVNNVNANDNVKENVDDNVRDNSNDHVNDNVNNDNNHINIVNNNDILVDVKKVCNDEKINITVDNCNILSYEELLLLYNLIGSKL